MRRAVAVRVGDLCDSAAAAVVRPVRSDGESVTSAGRRLEALAGPEPLSRLRGLGELPVGGAVITPGGDAGPAFIIHAVVQSTEEPVSAAVVRRALVNALRRARDLGLPSLALPPVGMGAGNLDGEDAARLLVAVLGDHLREGEAPRSFEIVVESPYEAELLRREVSVRDPVGELP